uniref:JmjC domain-containing protein n=1 Tax=Haptolina brevifila TaxID=156173 RepID=A0A7S2HK10_9EUKA|mmetsp:Transcript_55463/g.110172  ORF Transcript_55463/g.110172 Transcript_55463/m.110172 type:complete len:591 (+) Transcript_55463:175-1947(+)
MKKMEEVWAVIFPALFAKHPDLYYWKTCIFSPVVLAAFGIPVYRCVAEPGTFMFTSPAAYHSGFNTGFNIAESTNFAFADWIPTGARCLRRYRQPPTRDTTLLHEALVCTAVQHAQPGELPALLDELRSMLQAERLARQSLREAGVVVPAEQDGDSAATPSNTLVTFANNWADGADDSAYFFTWRCRVCRHLCYFSVVQCGCASDRYMCPEHGLHMPSDDDGTSQPASYIHLDEDPDGAQRVAVAGTARLLSVPPVSDALPQLPSSAGLTPAGPASAPPISLGEGDPLAAPPSASVPLYPPPPSLPASPPHDEPAANELAADEPPYDPPVHDEPMHEQPSGGDQPQGNPPQADAAAQPMAVDLTAAEPPLATEPMAAQLMAAGTKPMATDLTVAEPPLTVDLTAADPPSGCSACDDATPAAQTSATAAAAAASAAPVAPPPASNAGAPLPLKGGEVAPKAAGGTQAEAAQKPEGQLVRFPCGECGKRLKAKVPPGTRKISTVCTACNAHIMADVSLGGVGQEAQAGRARQMAGGGTMRSMGGGASSLTANACGAPICYCPASKRKLLVRHPMLQMQRLLDDNMQRLPAAA